jgi:hypothetical protein
MIDTSNTALGGFSVQLTGSPVGSVTFIVWRSVLVFKSSRKLVESGRLFMTGG